MTEGQARIKLFHLQLKNVLVISFSPFFCHLRPQAAWLKLPFRPPAGWTALSVHRHHCHCLHRPFPQIQAANKPPRVSSAAGLTHGELNLLLQDTVMKLETAL